MVWSHLNWLQLKASKHSTQPRWRGVNFVNEDGEDDKRCYTSLLWRYQFGLPRIGIMSLLAPFFSRTREKSDGTGSWNTAATASFFTHRMRLRRWRTVFGENFEHWMDWMITPTLGKRGRVWKQLRKKIIVVRVSVARGQVPFENTRLPFKILQIFYFNFKHVLSNVFLCSFKWRMEKVKLGEPRYNDVGSFKKGLIFLLPPIW